MAQKANKAALGSPFVLSCSEDYSAAAPAVCRTALPLCSGSSPVAWLTAFMDGRTLPRRRDFQALEARHPSGDLIVDPQGAATGVVTDMLGTDPIGYIAYNANYRIMALVGDRHPPSGQTNRSHVCRRSELQWTTIGSGFGRHAAFDVAVDFHSCEQLPFLAIRSSPPSTIVANASKFMFYNK